MKALNNQLTKTASIKARPSSQRVSATELEQFFARQGPKRNLCSYTLNSRLRTSSRPPKVYGSVAEMKRSKASRLKLTDVLMKAHKDFSSTPNLKAENVSAPSNNHQTSRKRSLSQEDIHNIQGNRHSWACTSNGYLGLCDNEEYSLNYNDAWKSIEDVYDSNVDIYAQTLPLPKKDKRAPPPSYPPPPPPVGQVVKVDVSKALGEYANVNEEKNSNVMSSFRPGDSAKLYAPPEVVMSVGYKSETASVSKDVVLPRRVGGGSSLRSQSLPPKISVNKSDKGSATSSEAENSGDSGGLYSTFKKTSRQRDSMSTDSGHVSDRGALWPLKGKPAATSAYSSKFDCEDSDAGSPQNYPTVKTPIHEPFIPEPDYESSEDDFMPTSVDKGGTLSTFGKGDVGIPEEKVPNQLEKPNETESSTQLSPHTEAKRAIQEARERLRFSQKPLDKNATVVFISGKITEHKVEKSEIQLHRTEEGRLTGTVVISTTNEPQEPLYLSSSILKTYENEKCAAARYPSRDAPASEYAKYRQQILSGINQSSDSLNAELENKFEGDMQPENGDLVKSSEQTATKPSFTEELKITLTGAQKCPVTTAPTIIETKQLGTNSHLNEHCKEDVVAISSSAVSNIDTHSDPVTILSSSAEEDSKAETVVHLPESGHISESQTINQSKSDKHFENRSTYKTEEVLNVGQRSESSSRRSAKEVANSLASELQGLRSNIEGKSKVHADRSHRIEHSASGGKNAQTKDKKHSVSPLRQKKHTTDHVKVQSSTEKSLEESLEVLKLQVSSLGLAAVNDVDVFTELVPPPPEFAAATEHTNARKESYSSSEIAIAPPPEFSDNSPQLRNRSSHRTSSNTHQRKNCSVSCHLNTTSNSLDLNFLTSLRSKSPNIMQMMPKEKKSRSSSGTVNVHLPCTSGLRHLPSYNPSDHSSLHESAYNELSRLKSVQKEFRFKLLQEWTSNDIADWLDSLFLPEYKQRFSEAGITGAKLANMDSNDLMGLGVKQMGHRLNMERSLKRYLK